MLFIQMLIQIQLNVDIENHLPDDRLLLLLFTCTILDSFRLTMPIGKMRQKLELENKVSLKIF